MITKTSAKYLRASLFFRRKPIFALILLIGVSMCPLSVHAFDILLGMGTSGTFSNFTGRVLCRVINSHTSDINCQTVPTPDDVHTLKDVHNLTNIQGGALDIGVIDSRMLIDAVNKTGHFEFLDISYENLRLLTPLYDIPVTLIARDDAGIASLNDLKGKRINAGAPISLERLAVDTIIKAKNWSKADFSLLQELPASQSQDTMAFCYGEVQAMVHIGVHPDPSLQQLLDRCRADLVNMDDGDIEKLISDHPAFWKINIAADTYPSRSAEVATFGTRAMLVASEDLDEETVSKIIDAIASNQSRLAEAHPALSLFSVDTAKKSDAGIQLHPGAAKYLSEQ